jgi:hypothetical protein
MNSTNLECRMVCRVGICQLPIPTSRLSSSSPYPYSFENSWLFRPRYSGLTKRRLTGKHETLVVTENVGQQADSVVNDLLLAIKDTDCGLKCSPQERSEIDAKIDFLADVGKGQARISCHYTTSVPFRALFPRVLALSSTQIVPFPLWTRSRKMN